MKTALIYRILLLTAVALTCASCSMDNPYTPPYPDDTDEVFVDIQFSGTVSYAIETVDEDGQPTEQLVPIPNIRVVLMNNGAEIRTNPNGIFFMYEKDVNIGRRPNLKFKALFEDTDGHAHGGKFIVRTYDKPVEVPIDPLEIDFNVVLYRDYAEK